MKKILIMCAILQLFIITSISAEDSITVDVDVYTVNVSLTSDDELSLMTMQLLNKEKTKVYYIAEQTGSGNNVVFDTFNLSKSHPSGDYIVRIASKDKAIIESTPIHFTNPNEIRTALNDLEKATDFTGFDSVFKEKHEFFSLENGSEYISASEKTRKKIYEVIAPLDLTVDDGVIDEEIINRLSVVLEAFKENYEKELEAAIILEADSSSAMVDLAEKSLYQTLDIESLFYKGLNDKEKVYNMISSDGLFEKKETLFVTLTKSFDGAVTIQAIKQNDDWQEAKSAFDSYVKKYGDSFDTEYYNKLSNNQRVDLFMELKNASYSSTSDLCAKAAASAKKIYKSESYSGGLTSGSSGGSSGGSSNRVVVSNGRSVVPTEKAPEAVSEAFNDIADVYWAAEAIEYLRKNGTINGDGNGKFLPNDNVTRAEFTKMALLAFKMYTKNETSDFDDVEKNAWYYSYVSCGKKVGLINGNDNNKFMPESNLSREDAAVILNRVYTMARNEIQNTVRSFSDSSEISDYAYTAVNNLLYLGIINGMENNKFSPKSAITRAQCAKMIYETINALGGIEH